MEFVAFVILAAVVQYLAEIFKKAIPAEISGEKRSLIIYFITLILGLVIGICAKLDFFAAVGVPLTPAIISYVVSGIMISAGSVPLNELIKLVTEIRPSNKTTVKKIE